MLANKTSRCSQQKNTTPGLFHLLKTAAAAAFGVQSKKNLETDFSQKTIIPYIVIGVLFTALFVLSLVAIVSLVV